MGKSNGLVSGTHSREFDIVGQRVRRIAGGLRHLGIREGDCVCILMRNDITFLEITYAVMLIGGYAVPINWHFKVDEVAYVVSDTAARVLIGHADLLHPLGKVIPDSVRQLCADVPQDIATTHDVDTIRAAAGDRFEAWLEAQQSYDGPPMSAPASMIYTSGTTGNPKGVRRDPPRQSRPRGTSSCAGPFTVCGQAPVPSCLVLFITRLQTRLRFAPVGSEACSY